MQTVFEHPLFYPILIMLVIVAIFPLAVGYMVLIERKVLADFQTRLGPMRVGPHGLMQPIADAVKLLQKEDIIPTEANKWMFWFAPCISLFTALTCFAVVPFSDRIAIADVNVGLLVISAMSAVGILGIILGGWSSNSHYPLLGGLRSAAQLVSYEVALALALLPAVMSAGTLSLVQIVKNQQERGIWFVFDNFGLMIIPFAVYFISAIAETNRAPFDLPEAESELVAGFHTEYSGFRWAVYMLAEYGNMFVVGCVAVTLFWGGWLRPFASVGWLDLPLNYVLPFGLIAGSGAGVMMLARKQPSDFYRLVIAGCGAIMLLIGGVFLIPAWNPLLAPPFWFFLKLSVLLYSMIWFRGTFPRYRYDQLMNIGWKVMIPTALGAIFVNAIVGMLRS